MNPNQQNIIVCDECGSEYYRNSSHMTSLCPECASILYGYSPCNHLFIDGRCKHCYWNGNHSRFVSSLIENID